MLFIILCFQLKGISLYQTTYHGCNTVPFSHIISIIIIIIYSAYVGYYFVCKIPIPFEEKRYSPTINIQIFTKPDVMQPSNLVLHSNEKRPHTS